MRPVRLDLAGFAAFREPTTVDFSDADFFALVGPTGAGKSTVLDGICFALYGTAPRWRGGSSVANALSPSANEARVRLVFDTAGQRYVATRVVRRDGKGRVKTAGAALQRMPAGFDPRKLDTGLTPEELGEPLAGSPSELDAAVSDVVGLPYDQFVTCVILPQGQFAEFLHAKPAARQQILVNLLGLSVYERVRELAVARAGKAEAELDATDRLLRDLSDVDDAAVTEAAGRLAELTALGESVAQTLPEVARAEAARDRAASALATRDEEIAQLTAVEPPTEVTALAEAAGAAKTAWQQAAEAVSVAEDQEEKVRAELAGAGDPTTARELLAQHQQREQLVGKRDALASTVAEARKEHHTASEALAAARAAHQRALQELEEARTAYSQAQTADAAGALRVHLVAGEPCPVCTQPVATVPPAPEDSAAAAAQAAGKRARQAADSAGRQVDERDATARELERALTAATTQLEGLTDQVEALDRRLGQAPGPEALERELATIAEIERRLSDAGTAVRRARAGHRQAREAAEEAEQRLRSGWRQFDTVRDGLALHSPPPVDREDLAVAWGELARWASQRATELRSGRELVEAELSAAEADLASVWQRLVELFTDAALDPPDRVEDAARAATVAVERARAEHERRQTRLKQAERLREQRSGAESQAQVARTLAQHLRANNFEAWLLEEALDRLVEGASEILRELSGGQYDLVHDGRELFVLDHHDAGLRRAVRTLSGGETFQASLSLALALSEQLAGLASTAASLESIVLDEGFGTLDAATLDAVAATLESLAARGDRMVGVVTHVPALAERIPVRYEVAKDARTAHVVRTGF